MQLDYLLTEAGEERERERERERGGGGDLTRVVCN